jgi:hypothetical protein
LNNDKAKDKLLKTIYVPNYAGKQKDKNEKSKAPGLEQQS